MVSRLAANHRWPVAQMAIPQCLVPNILQYSVPNILDIISERPAISERRDMQHGDILHSRDML
jgi:hypothetical protein